MSDHSNGWKLIAVRVAGLFLGVAGLLMGYCWYYQLGPMRRFYDPSWSRQHSEMAYWEEYQKCIDRSGWDHNGFWYVGSFGDKHWVQWIMDHIRPGDNICSCSAGHKSAGLRLLTNQDAGDTAEAWLVWWKQNKSKSQEDWIQEGFQKLGVDFQKPLTQANVVALLRLAAYPKEEGDTTHYYVQYNAFRWLRDSDFDPKKFAVKDLPAKNADQVLQGLLRFARLSGEFPKYFRLGVLNLGESPRDSDLLLEISTPKVKTLANVAVFLPICAGLLLVLASCPVFWN